MNVSTESYKKARKITLNWKYFELNLKKNRIEKQNALLFFAFAVPWRNTSAIEATRKLCDKKINTEICCIKKRKNEFSFVDRG